MEKYKKARNHEHKKCNEGTVLCLYFIVTCIFSVMFILLMIYECDNSEWQNLTSC